MGCMRSLLIAIVAIGLIHNPTTSQPPTVSFDDIIHSVFNTDKEYPASGNGNQNTTPKPTPKPTPSVPVSEPNKYRSCGFERECVPRFLCQNDSINADGTNLIDIRVHGECEYLEVCCDLPNKREVPVIDPVPPEKHEGCGYRNPDGVGYRIEGAADNEAEFGEFPWMVAILREEEDVSGQIRYAYEGGGALIAPNVIITAAHCVKNRSPDELVVRVGEWDTQTEAELLPYEDAKVSEIIVHEKYRNRSLWNDIAILFLKDSVRYAENVRPICLPPHDTNFDTARCFTTGWGKDKFGKDGVYQSILKRIDLPIMPHDQCQENLRTTRVGRYFVLHDSFICAGGELGKDACTGDGGSPLVCPVPGVQNRFYHAGIVAWGIGCGEVNIPGVYGNIAYLRPWIDHHLSEKGIDFSHFSP